MSANSSSDMTNKMSKSASKSKMTKTEVVAAVAAVAAPVATVGAPTTTKTTKVSKKTAPTVEVSETAPVAAPVVAAPTAAVVDAVSTTVAAPVVDESDVGAVLTKSIAELHEQLSTVKTTLSAALAGLKTIEKQAARVVKKAERRRKRKTAQTEGGAESTKACIFTKPVQITDELCSFLGKSKGSEVSRSEVTKGVMAYAKSHNLMDKQTIKADATLRKLLALTEADTLTILNLQKYLGRHYVKAAPAAN